MQRKSPVDSIYSQLPKCSVKQYVGLCEDAIFVCGEDGTIMTCNDRARALVGTGSVEGAHIRNFFSFPHECNLPEQMQEVIVALSEAKEAQVSDENLPHIAGIGSVADPEDAIYSKAIPFYKDAAPQIVICTSANDVNICRLRCQVVDEHYGTYLVVVHEIELMWEIARRQLEETHDLRKMNKRLQGALTTIVETINSKDIHMLFRDSLLNLQKTLGCDSAVIYLAEKDGFHLQEAISLYEEMPIFMPMDSGLPQLALIEEKTTSAQVMGTFEKQGDFQLEDHFILKSGNGLDFEVPSYYMLPYDSFMSVPVWYGNHIIALIFMGWETQSEFDERDFKLMDSIAQYLSVQIMGASRVLRSHHRQKIAGAESRFYDRMNDYDDIDTENVICELKHMSKLLGIKLRTLSVSSYTGNTLLESERFGDIELPFSIDRLVSPAKEKNNPHARHEPNYRTLSLDGEVMQWVNNNFEPSRITTIDFGEVFGKEMVCALVRSIDEKPFDALEVKLFIRIGHFLQNLSKRITSSENNRKISCALQQGMQNTLQEVPGIKATSMYSSATAEASVGGDFYDLIKLPDNKACVIMGDVSGKGVEAASVSAAVKTSLGAYAWAGLNPCEMVRNLNHFLMGFSRFETFVTLFVGIVDLKSRKLTYCSAGHPPTFIYRANNQVLDLLNVQSGVVGAFDDMSYRDGVVDLETGDSIYLYTDGVIEARAEDGTFFGERNLRELVLDCAKAGIGQVEDIIFEAITLFTNDHLEDDSAVVALEFNFSDERIKEI